MRWSKLTYHGVGCATAPVYPFDSKTNKEIVIPILHKQLPFASILGFRHQLSQLKIPIEPMNRKRCSKSKIKVKKGGNKGT